MLPAQASVTCAAGLPARRVLVLEAVKELADAWALQEVLQEEGVRLLQVGMVP